MSRRARRFGFLACLGLTGGLVDWYTENVASRSVLTWIAVARIVALYKLSNPTNIEEANEMHRKAGLTLVDLCRFNEGLYIKFAQGVSTLNHVLPPEMLSELKALLDNAAPINFDDIRATIEADIGAPLEEIFEYFDPKPVATASIAQVHRARIHPGFAPPEPTENAAKGPWGGVLVRDNGENSDVREVAVKVLKPRVAAQLDWDLWTHTLSMRLNEYVFGIPLMWCAETVERNMRAELDFLNEAANMRRATQLLQHRRDVAIPRVVGDLTRSRVLVAEWIDGLKLADVDAVKNKFDASSAMRSLVEVFGELIFKHGFLHADPHLANVLIRARPGSDACVLTPSHAEADTSRQSSQSVAARDQQLVLLDWGLAVALSEEFRCGYARMFEGIFIHDLVAVAEVASSWGIRDGEVFASMQIQKPVNKDVKLSKQHLSKADVAEFQRQLKSNMMTMLEDDSKIPRELVFVGRAMNILRSVNKSYGAPVNRVNILAEAAVCEARKLHRWTARDYFAFSVTTLTLQLLHVLANWWATAAVLVGLSSPVGSAGLEDALEMHEEEIAKAFRNPHGQMTISASD